MAGISSFRLRTLNLWRWVRAHAIAWTLLAAIYSVTAAILFQTVLQVGLRWEPPLVQVWAGLVFLLLIPALIEKLPLPALSAGKRPLGVLPPGVFSEGVFARTIGPLGQLYLRHELRRGPTWLAILISVLAGALLPKALAPFWVFIVLLPVQRALFSAEKWHQFVRFYVGARGPWYFLGALWTSQLLQYLVVVVATAGIRGEMPVEWIFAGASAVVAGASMAFEGDTGKPGLVHLLSLTAGVLAGVFSMVSPWVFLAVVYFASRMLAISGNRLKSVEWFDEDTVLP